MTTTDLAAAILRDVPKDALAKIVYDAMRFERQNDTPDWAEGGNSSAQAEARHAAAKVQDAVLAALTAALDPALSERAGEVLEGVTPGPWVVDALQLGTQGDITTADGEICIAQAQMRLPMASGKKDTERAANARFIAWCREGVPALLAQNAALRAERDELSSKLEVERALTDAVHRLAKAAEAQIAALTARVEGLTGAAKRVLAPLDEPCRHDHHGYCQTHFVEAECSVAALRAALSTTTEEGHDPQA